MTYRPEEIIEPFWSEFSSAASGRDPLSLQNSSVVIYSKMVVGITNVTHRIRYNGFFCWIFETIVKELPKSKKNSLTEQMRYLRRAELLLSYIVVKNSPKVTGTGGTKYANKNISNTINLEKGADWEFKQKGEKVYFQHQKGIFGQYYSGVTRVLDLVNHPKGDESGQLNIYTTTHKGKDLADAFIEKISQKESNLFWESVQKGSINVSELENLKSFQLHKIPKNFKEMKLYEEILLNADDTKKIEPTFHRRDTIKLILKHLRDQEKNNENPVKSFLRFNYRSHLEDSQYGGSSEGLTFQKGTASAWNLYEINEIIHVAFEHFHSCFLYFIETYPSSLENNINELVQETIEAFKLEDVSKGVTTIDQLVKNLRYLKEDISESSEDIYISYDEMEKSFRLHEFGKCLMYAVTTLLHAHINIIPQYDKLLEFAKDPKYNFNRNGYAIDLIMDLVSFKQKLSIQEYVKTILLKAINLHIFSSYSKTKIGQRIVHNYLIEDHDVWRLRETKPNRTSPRLQNILQYITDIDWVQKDGKFFSITDKGNKIISGQ